MEYIQKLTSLFVSSTDKQKYNDQISQSNKLYDLINMLQQKHVIAGGSIVWLLNDFVSTESVGDIDVFVNMEEEYTKLVSLLKTEYNAASLNLNKTIHLYSP